MRASASFELGDERVVDAAVAHLRRYGRVQLRLWGRSMLPIVWPGLRCSFVSCSPESLRVGDVVLVRFGHKLVAHRLLTVEDGRGLLQADWHAHPDGTFDLSRVLARAEGVPAGRGVLRVPRAAQVWIQRGAVAAIPAVRRAAKTWAPGVQRAALAVARLPPIVGARRWSCRPWFEPAWATPTDLIARYVLRRGMRPTSDLLRQWALSLEEKGSCYLVARSKKAVMASVHLRADAEGGTLYDLYVLPVYRGLGIATALLRRAVDEGAAAGLPVMYSHVRPHSSAASAHRRLGFEACGKTAVSSAHIVFRKPLSSG